MTAAAKPRVSLTDAVYAVLRDRIVHCDLAPGVRITEKQLSAETGFGATPVREALARLDSEGLVITIPRKGYQVAPLTIKGIDDLFEVWGVIGPKIGALAARNRTEEQLANFERYVGAYGALPTRPGEKQKTKDWIKGAERVWRMFAEATGNARLVEINLRLQVEMSRVMTVVFDSMPPRIRDQSTPEWVAAIRERDEARMVRIVENFVAAAHEEVVAILRTWPSVMQSEVVPMRIAPRQ